MGNWFHTQTWSWPPSKFYEMCGTVPVSLFFMITGFLFWGKAVRSAGEVSWQVLYLSRLKRLAPLYISTIPLLLVLVGSLTQWTSGDTLTNNAIAIGRWLTVGLLGRPPINGLSYSWMLHTATWTLQYEWVFYLCLPILAIFAASRLALLTVAGVVIFVLFKPEHVIILNFLAGGIAAHVVSNSYLKKIAVTNLAAILATLLLVIMPLTNSIQYGWLHTLILFPFFIIVAFGNNLYGLLSCRASIVLGTISYSIYLLHVPLLQVSTRLVNIYVPINSLQDVSYSCLALGIGLSTVLISLATYRWIEFPFLASSDVHRRAGDRMGTPRAVSNQRSNLGRAETPT